MLSKLDVLELLLLSALPCGRHFGVHFCAMLTSLMTVPYSLFPGSFRHTPTSLTSRLSQWSPCRIGRQLSTARSRVNLTVETHLI